MSAKPHGRVARIHVEGFRSLRDVTFEPGPLTVLIGPNGAGKSNLLAAMRLMGRLPQRGLRRFIALSGGAFSAFHRGPKATPILRLSAEFEGGPVDLDYRVELEPAASDSVVIGDEYILSHDPGAAEKRIEVSSSVPESRLAELSYNSPESVFAQVQAWLDDFKLFHFHDTSATAPLRSNSRPPDDQGLHSDGSNLAAVLYRLRADHPASWRRISKLVQSVVPGIGELVPTGVDADPPQKGVRLDWVDDSGDRFGVADLSDGSLRAIALITAFSQPDPMLPRYIMVDEPELGLHPSAIATLVSLIRSVSGRCQTVIATQSPALLDHFSADEVVVVERAAGATSLRRLSTDALADWLDDYSLSELYDKNVFGGRP